MDVNNSFQSNPFSLPLGFVPGRIYTDVHKGKGRIKFISGTDSNRLDKRLKIPIEKMQIIDSTEKKNAEIEGDVVHLDLTDSSLHLVRVSIKINELKKFLGEDFEDDEDNEMIKFSVTKNRIVDDIINQAKTIYREVYPYDSDSIAENEEKSLEEEKEEELVERALIMTWNPEASDQTPSKLDPHVRSTLISNLQEFEISATHFETIDKFYAEKSVELKDIASEIARQHALEFGFDKVDPTPLFIHRNSVYPPLPYNVIYNPIDPQKGLYIVTGKVIGVGKYNKLKLALYLDEGQKKAFRTALEKDVTGDEISINRKLQNDTEHFVVGWSVLYKGNYRPRDGIMGESRKNLDKFKNESKIGLMQDFIEGGDLAEYLNGKSPDFTQKLKIAYDVVKTIAKLNQKGYCHLDQKTQNFLITSDFHVKLCDFGLSLQMDTVLTYRGTRGYIAPELMQQQLGGEICKANSSLDLWSLGCVLMEIFYKKDFLNSILASCYENKTSNSPTKELDPQLLENLKNILLIERQNTGHVDYYIDQCLQLEPQKRLSAERVERGLNQLLKTKLPY